jgi:hypothetical protein
MTRTDPARTVVAVMTNQIAELVSGREPDLEAYLIALGGAPGDEVMPQAEAVELFVAASSIASSFVLALAVNTGIPVEELLATILDPDV